MTSTFRCVCSHCQAVNQLVLNRPISGFKCGSCKRKLFVKNEYSALRSIGIEFVFRVVCFNCEAVSDVVDSAPANPAKCGRCGDSLFVHNRSDNPVIKIFQKKVEKFEGGQKSNKVLRCVRCRRDCSQGPSVCLPNGTERQRRCH
jgi:hypothetical protein